MFWCSSHSFHNNIQKCRHHLFHKGLKVAQWLYIRKGFISMMSKWFQEMLWYKLCFIFENIMQLITFLFMYTQEICTTSWYFWIPDYLVCCQSTFSYCNKQSLKLKIALTTNFIRCLHFVLSQISYRVFALDAAVALLELPERVPDSSFPQEDLKFLQHKFLIQALIFSRCSDKAPTVRSKALSCLAQFLEKNAVSEGVQELLQGCKCVCNICICGCVYRER